MIEILRTSLFILISVTCLICLYLVSKGQLMIVSLHKEVLGFIVTFRKEMHEEIKKALSVHVKEYHS